MAAPLIFINTYAIKEGKLEGLTEFLRDLFKALEANEPRALAVNAYLNDDRTEVAIVQVHPDADAVKDYWRVIHQRTGREIGLFLDAPTSTQVFGDSGGLILERTRHSAEAGVLVMVKPDHLGGFTRLQERTHG